MEKEKGEEKISYNFSGFTSPSHHNSFNQRNSNPGMERNIGALTTMSCNLGSSYRYQKPKTPPFRVICRRKEREREHSYPYKVIEITPPPKNLGIRCLPQNLQCGESVTIEGQAYTVSSVTHRYQLRKGKYEPSEKRLDVLSTGRYILNLYLENLLEQS